MIEIWYAILSFMLVVFVVLEGFDIGAGLLQYVVGKTEAERRLVIAAMTGCGAGASGCAAR